MTNKKFFFAGLWFFALLILFCFSASAARGSTALITDQSHGNTRVFDRAGLWSEDEERQLEETIRALRQKNKMDVVLVSVNSTGGLSVEKYSDLFYIDGNFGYGDDYSGAMLLIDMGGRELYVNAVGKTVNSLTDRRRERILDHVYQGASEGDFYRSAKAFLKDVNTYCGPRSILWYEALLAAALAAALAAVPCLSVRSAYAMKKERGMARDSILSYRANCRFQCDNKNDRLIHESVTHVAIPRNTGSGGGFGGGGGGSTTHTSSGRTFSGSGRKF